MTKEPATASRDTNLQDLYAVVLAYEQEIQAMRHEACRKAKE